MSRTAWRVLMQAGLRDLQLTPEQFWALTPAELMLMLGADAHDAVLSRARFEELSRAYPDVRNGREA